MNPARFTTSAPAMPDLMVSAPPGGHDSSVAIDARRPPPSRGRLFPVKPVPRARVPDRDPRVGIEVAQEVLRDVGMKGGKGDERVRVQILRRAANWTARLYQISGTLLSGSRAQA